MPRRSQYSLRTLCFVTFCCAILFGVTVRFGLIATATLGAIGGLVWSINDDPHRWPRLAAFGLITVGIVTAAILLLCIGSAIGRNWLWVNGP